MSTYLTIPRINMQAVSKQLGSQSICTHSSIDILTVYDCPVLGKKHHHYANLKELCVFHLWFICWNFICV